MKRLIIVCEGPTENEFCLEMLAPILLKSDIYVEAPLIKKSNGGIVPWQAIKRQIETHLHEEMLTSLCLWIITESKTVTIFLVG